MFPVGFVFTKQLENKSLENTSINTPINTLFVACFNEQLLNKEIEQLRNVFHHTNGYPKAVIQNVI